MTPVSTVSTVSRECRVCVENVSRVSSQALPATRYWPFRRLAGEKDSGRPANRDGCESMLPGTGYGRCNIVMGQEDDMTGVTLQRAYGHSIPVLSAAMAGVLVAGANVSRRACVLERAHRQEAVDGVQLCCLLAGALQAGESAGILVLSGILVWAT